MATAKRARSTSSTIRSKTSAATPAQETNAALPKTQSTGSFSSNIEEAIRVRAYQLFEQRGRVHGHDVEDWLKALAEVSTRVQVSA